MLRKNRKSKRILALILTLLLAVSLCACGKGTESGGHSSQKETRTKRHESETSGKETQTGKQESETGRHESDTSGHESESGKQETQTGGHESQAQGTEPTSSASKDDGKNKQADSELRTAHSGDDWKKLLPSEGEWVYKGKDSASSENVVKYYYDGIEEKAPFDEKYHIFFEEHDEAYVDLLGKKITLDENLILTGKMTLKNGTICTQNGASIYSHGELMLQCDLEINGGAFANYGRLNHEEEVAIHVNSGIGIANYGGFDGYSNDFIHIYCDGAGTVGIENNVKVDEWGASILIEAVGEKTQGIVNNAVWNHFDLNFTVAGDSTAIVNLGELEGTFRCESMKSGIFIDNYGVSDVALLLDMEDGTAVYNRGTGSGKMSWVEIDMENGCAVYNEGTLTLGTAFELTMGQGRAIDNYGSMLVEGRIYTPYEKEYSGIVIYNHENAVLGGDHFVYLKMYRPVNAYGVYNEGLMARVDESGNYSSGGDFFIWMGLYGTEIWDHIPDKPFCDMRAKSSTGFYNASTGVVKDITFESVVLSEDDCYAMYCAGGSVMEGDGKMAVFGQNATALYVEKDAVAGGGEARGELYVYDSEKGEIVAKNLIGLQNEGTVRRIIIGGVGTESIGAVNNGTIEEMRNVYVYGNHATGVINNGIISTETDTLKFMGCGVDNVLGINNGTIMADISVRMEGINPAVGEHVIDLEVERKEGLYQSVGFYNKGTAQGKYIGAGVDDYWNGKCTDTKLMVNEGTLNYESMGFGIRGSGCVGMQNELTGTIYLFKGENYNGNLSAQTYNADGTALVNHGIIDAEYIRAYAAEGSTAIRNYENTITCTGTIDVETNKKGSNTGIYNDGYIRTKELSLDYPKDEYPIRGSGTISYDRLTDNPRP